MSGRRHLHVGFFIASMACSAFSSSAFPRDAGERPDIKVLAYGIHQNSQITYRYQVANNTDGVINSVTLGIDECGPGLPAEPWSDDTGDSNIPVTLLSSQCKPFDSMSCEAVVYQFDYMPAPAALVRFTSAELGLSPAPITYSDSYLIKARRFSSVAELHVPSQDNRYLEAWASASFIAGFPYDAAGKMMTSLKIPITKLDTRPPELNASVETLKAGTAMSAVVLLNVRDDYDPRPEVTLEGISANQPTLPTDITRNAGSDRSFILTTAPGRIYTVTYTATDGSGNASRLQLPIPAS